VKRILLAAWAEAQFDPPPSLWTLRRLVREGNIHPPPVLIGRQYYVEPTAKLLTADMPRRSLVEQL
jgi:hypothetical protein